MLLNPSPDDKILDWSKLKQIADDISNSMTLFNLLPDDKILDRSKLKQIADDILKCI